MAPSIDVFLKIERYFSKNYVTLTHMSTTKYTLIIKNIFNRIQPDPSIARTHHIFLPDLIKHLNYVRLNTLPEHCQSKRMPGTPPHPHHNSYPVAHRIQQNHLLDIDQLFATQSLEPERSLFIKKCFIMKNRIKLYLT